MRDQLRAPLPKDAVTKHPTKTYLSSIKGIYVTERLNDVFGVGAWSQKSTVQEVRGGMVVVHSKLLIPEYGVELESFGGNDNGGENGKNFDLGDAYKGACTDALSKMCSFLEIAIDVFKGNGNNPPAEPKKPETQQKDKAPEERSEPPKNDKVDNTKDLIPGQKIWDVVIAGLKAKGKTEEEWNEIKNLYTITPGNEILLKKAVGWQ